MYGCNHLKVLKDMNQNHKKEAIIKELLIKREDQKLLNFLVSELPQRKE